MANGDSIDDNSPANRADATAPAARFGAVVLSDTVDLPEVCRNLYIGTGGDIAIVTVEGVAVVYKNMQDGSNKVVRARRVNLTGTTAADIVWEA